MYQRKNRQHVDGDTFDVGENRIRLSLTSTPELTTLVGIEAKEYVEKTCPIGSDVLVDEDDGQIEGSMIESLARSIVREFY